MNKGKHSGTAANIDQGLGLLKCLMQDYPQLNLMVQSSNVNLDSDRCPDSRLLAPARARL